jgi:WD40 repeat protein
LAQYPLNPNTPSHRYEDPHAGPTGNSVSLPGDWPNDWSFWQFTEKGLVNGVEIDGRPASVDINYYNGSSTALANALKQVPFPSRPIGNPTSDLNSEIIVQPLTGQPGPINSLSYSESGKWLASASADGKLILWNMEQKSDPIILQQGGIVIHSVSISPDEHWLATGNGDGTVQIWNLETRKLRATLNGIPNRVLSVAFDRDSKLIAASGCAEMAEGECKLGQITIWRVADLQESNLTGHSDAINSIAFSPDNNLLASGSEDGTIIFWKTADWTKSDPIRDRPSGVLNLTFSHNGKWLASAGMDGTVSIWDVSSRQRGEPFKGHTLPVFGLAFNKDDSLLASGSWDKTITIWDVKARQQVGDPLRGHTDYIYSLAFSPDGKTLVSGSWDNTILLWDLDLQSWIKKACQVAGRNFTRAEWQQYFPGTTYPTKQEEATCPEWPLETEIKVIPTATP